jgi:hypothetical protein
MKNPPENEAANSWAKIAGWLGLLLTEPRVRAKVAQTLKDRAETFTDTASSTYDEALHRVESARDALRGRTSRGPQLVGFLAGVGVGAALGLLLAPTSGRETRNAMRSKASAAGSKIASSASFVAQNVGRASGTVRTGTEG